MYSSKVSLKNRGGILQNSTGSCRIENGIGWSYREQIFKNLSVKNLKTGKMETIQLWNTHNFSATTSRHYRVLDRGTRFTKVYIDLPSINKIEKISNIYLNYKKYIESYSLNLSDYMSKKDLEKLDAEIVEKIIGRKKGERQKRLRKNIENLNYNTEKGLLKALTKYSGMRIYLHVDESKIEKFFKVIRENKDRFSFSPMVDEKMEELESLNIFEKVG